MLTIARLHSTLIGMPTVMDNSTSLVINTDFVISLGAPKIGLLLALDRNPVYQRWELFVADIGINNSAWRKYGTKRKYGIDFGPEWVTALEYKS